MDPKKSEVKYPNTKLIPSIITLAAAFISCAVSIKQGVSFDVFVTRLLVIVVIFLVLSTIIKMLLDYSFRTLDEPKTIDDLADEELSAEEDFSEEDIEDKE